MSTSSRGQNFDYVLTVCDSANGSCPVYFGKAARLHHSFNDPAAVEGLEEMRLGAFRKVRDELRAYLEVSRKTTEERSGRFREKNFVPILYQIPAFDTFNDFNDILEAPASQKAGYKTAH